MAKVFPPSLRKKLSMKVAFDVTVFGAAVFVIYKFGKPANDMISEMVPSEASMRQ